MVKEFLQWIAVDNAVTRLDGSTYYLATDGRQGAYAVPASIVADVVPQQPGQREKYVQVGANQIKVPLVIFAPDEGTLAQVRRALKWAMNPTRGVGILRSTAADGAVRDLNCRLTDGLRGDETLDSNRGAGWTFVGLIFDASDPYWYDSQFTTLNFSTAAPVNFFANPFLPLQISSSGILSNFSVYNSGDALTWPVWTITGPTTGITLTNNTTGESLVSTLTLTGGQSLTIDTRPYIKTVTRDNGSNQFSTISTSSSLWALQTGNTSVSVTLAGTTGASSLQLQYKQRYEGV